jgi:hypothetical protein
MKQPLKPKLELVQTVPLTRNECEFLLFAIEGLPNVPYLDYRKLREKLNWTLGPVVKR